MYECVCVKGVRGVAGRRPSAERGWVWVCEGEIEFELDDSTLASVSVRWGRGNSLCIALSIKSMSYFTISFSLFLNSTDSSCSSAELAHAFLFSHDQVVLGFWLKPLMIIAFYSKFDFFLLLRNFIFSRLFRLFIFISFLFGLLNIIIFQVLYL